MTAVLQAIIQDFADVMTVFSDDSREIAKNIPINEITAYLMNNPDDIEGAFGILRTWVEEAWVPVILEQSTEIQKQAIRTAFQWG